MTIVVRAVPRNVIRAFDVVMPNGTTKIVHLLDCGCVATRGGRKTPAKKLVCYFCLSGAPRTEDIAWQAFQAGIMSDVARHEMLADDAAGTGLGRARESFRTWWQLYTEAR